MDSTAEVFSSTKFSERADSLQLTGSALADRLGVSPSTVSALRRGNKAPSAELLSRIAEVLGGSPTDYLNLPPRNRWELRHFRLVAGLSQNAVADILGVADSAVSGWEARRYRPPSALWPRLAELYGIDETELVTVIGRLTEVSSGQGMVMAVRAVVMMAEVMLQTAVSMDGEQKAALVDCVRCGVETAMDGVSGALPELRGQVRADAAVLMRQLAELYRQINS